MMSRAVIILNTTWDRKRASDWVAAAKDGTRIEFKGPKRTLPQNDRMWAMLTDVASQLKWHGVSLFPDDWKLLFMAAMKRELRIVPNLDGTGFVNLGQSSSDLSVAEMGDLMELISAFGASHGVVFNDQSAGPTADESGGAVLSADPGAAASNSGGAPPESPEQAPAVVTSSQAAGADIPRISEFARRLAAVIGSDPRHVVDEAAILVKELGIADENALAKARSITSAAVKACGNYGKPDGLPKDDALDLIAGLAGVERGALLKHGEAA